MNDASGNLGPHPLAAALCERLEGLQGARVLEIGTGSGRNRRALIAAGCAVESYEQLPQFGAFDAAISTHALLHGTRSTVRRSVRGIAGLLKSGAPFFATFASVRDARYGKGTQVAEHAFAPDDGEEAGVPHAYFDERALREMLDPLFEIESLNERRVDAIVGRWAHERQPSGSVHYFLIARKRRIDA